MTKRKQLIEEIMTNINAMKSKMLRSAGSGIVGHNKITHSQWFVLCLIEQQQNIGIKEIAKILGITSSAATQLVDGLVENDYVVRKTNILDKRSLQLYLSKKGQKHIKQMKSRYIKAMETIFKSLTDKELKIYNMLHKKILINTSHE